MRDSLTITLALATALHAPPVSAGEETWKPEGNVELGAFYHSIDDGQPDLFGQRLLVGSRLPARSTGQVDVTTLRRGSDDWGGQGALALWTDWTPHLFTLASASVSHSAKNFFPRWRSELELHAKVPRFERLVLFGGGGRAEFHDADTWIGTAGTTLYFDVLGTGNLTYRFNYFDNDFENDSIRADAGDGRAHFAQLALGREFDALGQVDIGYLYGTEFLRDFVVATGQNVGLESHNVYLGWRRHLTEQFGVHVQLAWGEQEKTYDRRLGAEVRFVWYFGPQPEWRDRHARAAEITRARAR